MLASAIARRAPVRLSRSTWTVVVAGTLLMFAMLVGLHDWRGRRHVIDSEVLADSHFVRVVGNIAWPLYKDFLAVAERMPTEDLKRHPHQARLAGIVHDTLRGSDVLKVKIFSPRDGRVLFSTDAEQIGTSHTNTALTKALGGQFTSTLEHRETFAGIHGPVKDKDIVASYLPYHSADASMRGQPPQMIVEVYSDVTQRMNALRQDRAVLLMGMGTTILVMYAILWWLGRSTQAQHSSVERHRRRQEATMRHQAYHDALTGLPNRMQFAEHCAVLNARHAGRIGVLFVDLDRFKPINDSLGHKVGDAVLKRAAQRIRKALRGTDRIYRMGGDEFIALIDTDDQPALEIAARRVIAQLTRAINVEGVDVHLSASVGISRWPNDCESLEQAVAFADLAMYAAKRAGAAQHMFYDPAMRREADDQVHLLAGLRTALVNDEFELHYQPRMDAKTGRIDGFEALLRWRHPEHGLLPPNRFIGILEESPLIFDVGTWVIERATQQLAQWHAAGHDALRVSVNVAARQFRHRDFAQTVEHALKVSGIAAHTLELEITESQLIHDLEGVMQTIERLKRAGVALSIDDFGTGYSSLAYLQKLRIDCIKIDQTFVRDLDTDVDDAKIARTIVKLAHSLGMTVVAEGVETERQATLLRSWGCEQLQGFLFSQAVPADDALWLLPKVKLSSSVIQNSDALAEDYGPPSEIFTDEASLAAA